MELVELVNAEGESLGTCERSVAHRDGLLHRIVVVYVQDSTGRILVQKRIDGRLDHSSAGHVDAGETDMQAAQRELKEELGISPELIFVARGIARETYKQEIFHHAFALFMAVADMVTPNPDEVRAVYWMTEQEIIKSMKEDTGGAVFTGGFRNSFALFTKQKHSQ